MFIVYKVPRTAPLTESFVGYVPFTNCGEPPFVHPWVVRKSRKSAQVPASPAIPWIKMTGYGGRGRLAAEQSVAAAKVTQRMLNAIFRNVLITRNPFFLARHSTNGSLAPNKNLNRANLGLAEAGRFARVFSKSFGWQTKTQAEDRGTLRVGNAQTAEGSGRGRCVSRRIADLG